MKKNAQTLITRLPYAASYDTAPILEEAKKVDERGLISLSIPIHLESPNNGGRLISSLEDAGLYLVAKIVWYRDRHIVATKSKRLTNTWEPIAIFSKSKNYIMSRDNASKIKKGFESRETAFDEDEYLTCIGDHWPIRNDRRDRRFLPETVVLNLIQLADLSPGDRVLDPYGNPGVRDACQLFGWSYVDSGLPSDARDAKTASSKDCDEDEPKEDEA
jgi:DNA modification methylase